MGRRWADARTDRRQKSATSRVRGLPPRVGRAPPTTKAQGKGWGALAGPMSRNPRWRVEEGLGSKGTPTSIGVTKRACCRTLWPQSHLVAPSNGLIATWRTPSALVVVAEGVATLNANDIIMHRMQFFKTTAPHVIGCGGRML